MNIRITPTAAAVRPLTPELPCIEQAYALLVLDRERLRLALAELLVEARLHAEQDCPTMKSAIRNARTALATIGH